MTLGDSQSLVQRAEKNIGGCQWLLGWDGEQLCQLIVIDGNYYVYN